jgi:hypothetical protein
MKNTFEIKLGLHVHGSDDWEPMNYSNYSSCVHAWRAVDPDWDPHFAEFSFEIAEFNGVLFG